MKKNKNGFTLVELTVVVVIIGILAAIAIPQYQKTIETSKAANAAAITHMIATANRMYHIDNPGLYAEGIIANGCGTDCAAATPACKLIACNYIAPRDWSAAASPYTYSVGPATCGSGILACSIRNSGPNAGTWGYAYDIATGACTAFMGAPACPAF